MAKKKSCEYCEQEQLDICEDNRKDCDFVLSVCPGRMISAYYTEKTESGEYKEHQIAIPCDYCPVCGRRLIL